eukprot:TRINITY_DN7680_c0_g1_i1.p2 TRINITY_DN7680_c0_g1~~TRINITY_DN7680_c0_g1_i1.p2  ORF type:complete len:247 (+),score=71.42 TRINITY_DN7680_c0_g1_i1:1200-1940(+)
MDKLLEKSQAEELIETFESAASYIKSQGHLMNLSEADMLYFYGRFKLITKGKCEDPKPGFFDLKGKRKWQAWIDVSDLEDEEAALQYIERLSEIHPDWDKESDKPDGKHWVSVSTMVKEPEEDKEDSDKTIFDWLKENNSSKVKSLILEHPECALSKDDSGLSPIHWAADRGAKDIVSILLNSVPEVCDARDDEGQTALHYASSCGHLDIVEALKASGSDLKAVDADGCTPLDIAFNEETRELLLS